MAGEEDALRQEILAALDAITSLDDDRILRDHLGTVDATVRTNAFLGRPHLSFKFASAAVPDMPKPYPLYEIFVYSPEMEGIHLRGGRVARGGIRWSDRPEDYRTEILGLMKAQMVKNAVIVPVGSKGGFVLKRPPADRQALREEVVRAVHDADVAACSTSPTTSSPARSCSPPACASSTTTTRTSWSRPTRAPRRSPTPPTPSPESYGFWLGDAFASGGSAGYDHKKLGITARGRVGVGQAPLPRARPRRRDRAVHRRRHRRHVGRRVRQRDAALGPDPAGRPRSTTATCSSTPTPTRRVGFAERERLFDLPGSSWDDYDRVEDQRRRRRLPARREERSRSAPRSAAALGLDDSVTALPPAELMTAILRAPVDLFWNGGIGTFVKASDESHADVGDRTNDAIRVDGRDLRVRVVGEGGNLGFTQRGRIEYAEAGGRINTDAIDNSAGVDCSDHEVNLKILLGIPEAAGDLTRKQRDELLAEVEDDVCRHVLYDNYLQAQILSQEVAVSQDRIEAYDDLMHRLESDGLLERPDRVPAVQPRRWPSAHRQGRAHGAPGAVRAARVRQAQPEDGAARGEPRRRPVPRPRAARLLPAAGRRAVRPPARPARRCGASWWRRSSRTTSSTRRASRSSRGSAPRRAPSRPRSRARTTSPARSRAPSTRWAAIEALDGKIDPSLQNELMVGVDSLVEDVARWYLLAPAAGRSRGRRSRRTARRSRSWPA